MHSCNNAAMQALVLHALSCIAAACMLLLLTAAPATAALPLLLLAAAGLQGFEGFLSSKEALRKRQNRAWKPEDRLFSLSSQTSPVVS